MARGTDACVAALALALGLSFAGAAQAAEPATLTAQVEGQTIEVYFYRPRGPGPFPLIVLSHGTPRDRVDFERLGPLELRPQAQALVDRGIAVAVPIRRGYGREGGRRAEGYGGCDVADFYGAGMAGARDVQAATAVAARQPGVDASRIVLMGVSGGAWASLAAATHGGVMGVVSFAGGRGNQGYEVTCRPDRLLQAVGRFGAATRVPELWIYSVNDHVFTPQLAAQMFRAFTAAGGQAAFRRAPAYGRDGHAYIEDVPSWRGMVLDFLKLIGFTRPGPPSPHRT